MYIIKVKTFGDEDDMLIVNLEYSDDRYAVLEYGNAFRWVNTTS